MSNATTTNQTDVDVYTPAELSFLLAGRESTAAKRARDFLGLTEVADGDTAVLVGAQSLVAGGRAAIAGGEVEIGPAAQLVGFLLGTASRWVRVSIQADDSLLAMAFVTAPDTGIALILRILPLGNIEIKAAEISVPASVGSLVAGYLDHHERVGVAVRADVLAGNREVAIERAGATAPLALLRMHGIPGEIEVAGDSDRELDQAEFARYVTTVVGE